MSVRYLRYRSIGATGASSSPRPFHDSRDETGETTRVTSTLPPQALLPGRLQITTSRKQNQRPRHPVSDIKDTHPGTPDNNRVGRTDHLPYLGVVIKERDELLPGVAPQPNCGRVALPPFGIEGLECLLGRRGVDRGVDRADSLGDGVAVLTAGVAERASDQMDDTGLHDGVG